MANPFQLNPDESILSRSQPAHQWYMLAWRIGVGFIEAFILVLLSVISFTGIARALLANILPSGVADGLSRAIFQGIVPILITAWFAEDTSRIFTSKLILTNQRIWTKGWPYAWSSGRETRLADIKSLSAQRDAIFIHLNYTKKVQVLVFPNGKQIVQAFEQLTEKTSSTQ